MIGRIARPYAKACFAVAGSAEGAQQLLKDVRAFAQTLEDSRELRQATANPGLPLDAKVRILDAVAAKLGSGPITRRLTVALARNYRLDRLSEIADGLEILVRRALGTVKAEVSSATALTPEQSQALGATLGRAVGRTVDLELSTDPTLLAGFVARVGSTVYDASLKRRLERLTARLAQA